MIKKERNKNKSHLVLVGSLLLLIALLLVGGNILYNYLSYQKEQKQIDNFLNKEIVIEKEPTTEEDNNVKENEEVKEEIPNYIGILEIPNISLKKGFYSIDNKNNNVNKNIEILQNSDMPNVENGLFAIAGVLYDIKEENGQRICYIYGVQNNLFNITNKKIERKLYKLNKDDLIYVYYQNIKYTYQITSITRQDKQGFITISRQKDTTELLLTTCDQQTKGKQVIVMSKLIEKSNY